MWRMALVCIFVVAVYFGVSARHDDSGSTMPEAFGEPWTLEELITAFGGAGVAVDVELTDARIELPFDAAGETLVAPGAIGGFDTIILIYPSLEDRRIVWREDPGRPEVWAEGYARIPEDHAWGIGNAVLLLSAWTGPGYGPSFDRVKDTVIALRGD
jgi:hypothetical protein